VQAGVVQHAVYQVVGDALTLIKWQLQAGNQAA
jgi:hypothetical protein